MDDLNLTLNPILEEELYTTPPLMTVVVAKLAGTKLDIPRAFRLTSDIPHADLRHLRRLRHLSDGSLECILCRLADEEPSEEKLKELQDRFRSENIFHEYRYTQVPSKAPRTEQQLKACNAIWPCKFAKSNHLVKCIEGSLLTEQEILVLKIISDETSKILNSSEYASIAVIFRFAKVYGVGTCDKNIVESHPVQHSTMLAIDSVATNAQAGHWRLTTGDSLMWVIQSKLDNQDSLKSHCIDHNFLPYLCTNYDVFITEEPCFMCTMGLVQSRIRRLFYMNSDKTPKLCYPDKAIEGHLVHRDRNLNHRFEAWRVTLNAGVSV